MKSALFCLTLFAVLLSSCKREGCTNPKADNYAPDANEDDGSCYINGCTDEKAANYSADATLDDGTCQYTYHEYGKLLLCFKHKMNNESGFHPKTLPGNVVSRINTHDLLFSNLHLHGDVSPSHHSDLKGTYFLSRVPYATSNDAYIQEFNIKAGQYTGLKFNFGVDPEINAEPGEARKSNALLNFLPYLTDYKSFAYLHFSGELDTDGDYIYDSTFSYIMGHDSYNQEINLDDVHFEIESGKTAFLTIEIDWDKILEGVDIKDNLILEGKNSTFDQMSKNLSGAIRVES
ncbi:hypothetical protein KFE98_08930 [bacterium SCSIO 12741]|nr:hypothetical protein KFE98_08930 [bacterium SCSIO 12741]